MALGLKMTSKQGDWEGSKQSKYVLAGIVRHLLSHDWRDHNETTDLTGGDWGTGGLGAQCTI